MKLHDQKLYTDYGPFTKDEQRVMELIIEAHNIFAKMDRQHPNEIQDWVNGIHSLQNILGWRILRRDYPNLFPIKK